MNEKLCPRCQKIKPTSEFWKSKAKSDGFQSHCKTCKYSGEKKRLEDFEYKQVKNKIATESYHRRKAEIKSKRANLRRERIENGLCGHCGKNPREESKTECSDCRFHRNNQNRKTRHERRTTKKLCVVCGKKPFEVKTSCTICYLKKIARGALKNSNLAPLLLEKLEKQNYRCPYTDSVLVLGENAVLDHKFPRSRFPNLQNDIENVEWIRQDVNMFKYNLTPEEFLSLIEVIYDHRFSKSL